VSIAGDVTEIPPDRFAGCLLGLALGDAFGAPLEGGPLERLLWRLIGTTGSGLRRWTDDTQMSLDVAESLIARGALDPDDLAARFAGSYRWSRGYGRGAATLLKRIARGADWRQANRSVFPQGSYGNGGAMRAPVVGLFYANRPDELAGAAQLSARITHAHPLGLEGAVLVASAVASAAHSGRPLAILAESASRCTEQPFVMRLQVAEQMLQASVEPGAREVAVRLGNGIAASESCVTAVYIAVRFVERSFPEMLDFVGRLGGDVDTIASMSAAIWGAARGLSALPESLLERLEDRERIAGLANELALKAGSARYSPAPQTHQAAPLWPPASAERSAT